MTDENLKIMLDGIKFCGKYDFPVIRACSRIPPKLTPFNFALTEHDKTGWLHFFIDDYQFERLWNNPMRYLPVIKSFGGVIAPNFSLFWDMPIAQQIYNCWRNRVISAWLQKEGLDVIPVVEWSDRSSLEWCLEGLPKRSTIAVQTNGCFTSAAQRMNLVRGMEHICNVLDPSTVLVYGRGKELEHYFKNVHFVESYCQSLKKRL